MNAPQITIIVLYAMQIGIALVKHGEPRKEKYSVWTTMLGTLIGVAILWWGGFWN